jgi:hypothetical protein
MSNNNSYAPSIDNVLAGVLLMLGFCITAPSLDVAAKLASDIIAVGQITVERFIVHCVHMAPVVWLMGLPFEVARKQWLAMLLRATFY